MDQLKTIAKQVQKHHFWLLCVAAMIMALTGWIMASRSLSAVYAERKIAIMAKFTDLQGIQSTENPPNNEWKTAIDKLTDEERKKVASAWALVYNQQKDLLRWPEELGPQFLNFVNTKPQNAEIPQQFCGYYMDNVKNEFPKLSAIINADGHGTKPAAAAAAKPDRPTASPPDKPLGASTSSAKVAWDAANQSEIQRTLTWSTIPTSQQVRLAQEDLWVYQALLLIIRKVNEGHYVAPIRKISAITIGRPAAEESEAGMSPNHIYHIPAAAGAAAAEPVKVVDPAAGPPALDEKRYVGPDGAALASGATANDQFKRMPVSLRLTIDQRQLNKLLVECANSPLPVEVRQLRINPSNDARKPEPQGASGGQSAVGPSTANDSYDVPVELHGIIYIFNPPDPTKVGGALNATADAGTPAPTVGAPGG